MRLLHARLRHVAVRPVPRARRPDRGEINDALAGNLCRCTGYGPIVTAAENMYGSPRRIDRFDASQAATLGLRAALQKARLAATVSGDCRRFFAPTRLDELARAAAGRAPDGDSARRRHRCRAVGDQAASCASIPSSIVGNVAELQRIDVDGHAIDIGAAVTYRRSRTNSSTATIPTSAS